MLSFFASSFLSFSAISLILIHVRDNASWVYPGVFPLAPEVGRIPAQVDIRINIFSWKTLGMVFSIIYTYMYMHYQTHVANGFI